MKVSGNQGDNEGLVERALALLNRPAQKVSPRQWMDAYNELAALTKGLTGEEDQFATIMKAIDCCDDAFRAGDWQVFVREAERVKRLCQRPY